MEYARLGPTGVGGSRICVGTATFGWHRPSGTDRVIHAALDLGVSFFDTASVYGILPIFDRPGVLPPVVGDHYVYVSCQAGWLASATYRNLPCPAPDRRGLQRGLRTLL